MEIKNPQKIFLLDGFGAILSAVFLGIVLVQFNSYFGMPVGVLYGLAVAAATFAIYSLSCYFFAGKNWKSFLAVIAVINALYCCFTAGLVWYHFQKLTTLGVVYFGIEIVVIIVLIWFERKAVFG